MEHHSKMTPLKVIHVITRLDWGGSAQNTLLTALGHDREQYLPSVIAGDPGVWDAQGGAQVTEKNQHRLEAQGISMDIISTFTRPISPMNDLKTLWTLICFFRQKKPTIVHTHTSKAGVLGRLASWIARVPVVIHTPHGHVFYGHFGRWKSWLFWLIEYVLAIGTTRMIGLTEAERTEHLTRKVGVAKSFAVVPSGIDLKRFQDAVTFGKTKTTIFSCPSDAIVIGSVGWLTKIKGHQFLIEALGLLYPRFPKLQCVIIGGGPLRKELTSLAKNLGIAESIHFFERRDDIPECLAAMNIFVLPSLMEGMGRALIEAMAVGLPVIASNVGGIPAVVSHERTGLLVPPGNPEALAKAITLLIERPEFAQEIAKSGRDHIDAWFDTTSMVHEVEAVYRDALNQAKVGLPIGVSCP